MPKDSGISGIAFDNWPDADRRLWASLVLEGDLFEGTGPLCGLRPTTLRELRRTYGYFLGHLARSGVDLDAQTPKERITPRRLRTFVEASATRAPSSRSVYAARLLRVLSAAFPDVDLGLLRAAARNLHRRAERAGPFLDRSQVPTSDKLLAVGLEMILDARAEDGPIGRDRAEDWRDGLMIAFLAAHPMRIRNFAELELGRTLVESGDGFRVSILGTETKTARPIGFAVAGLVKTELADYLRLVRPTFAGGADPRRGRLWLTRRATPLSPKSAGRRIGDVLLRQIGVRVTPHVFRHAAATTLAVTEGADARLARPLLGHARPEMTEHYYIMAGSLDASRRYGRLLDRLRRERPKGRRA